MLNGLTKNAEKAGDTVDGRNPAAVEVGSLCVYPIIYDGMYTSQVVVWDFFHQQYRILIPRGRMETTTKIRAKNGCRSFFLCQM